MSNDTSVFPVALLENWIARGETPRNVNDARKHQESVNRKRLSTYFDASLLQIVTRPQADFRVLIRTVPILDYFRIADNSPTEESYLSSECNGDLTSVWNPGEKPVHLDEIFQSPAPQTPRVSSNTVISGRAPSRMGKPVIPMPRLT